MRLIRTCSVAILLSLAAAAAAPAFAHGEPTKADVILVREASEVAGCERLAEVEASSLMTGLLASKGRARTISRLKERAATLGGTHVRVLSTDFSYATNYMLGVAYRCPITPTPAPAQP